MNKGQTPTSKGTMDAFLRASGWTLEHHREIATLKVELASVRADVAELAELKGIVRAGSAQATAIAAEVAEIKGLIAWLGKTICGTLIVLAIGGIVAAIVHSQTPKSETIVGAAAPPGATVGKYLCRAGCGGQR
jgi:hypothetical protein